MRELGERMRAHRVRDILFVHGTFRGYDPFGMLLDGNDGAVLRPLLGELANMFLPRGLAQLQELIKQGVDRRAGDLANFPPSYVQAAAEQLGHDVCRTQHPFVWSGANLHVARLDAALGLLDSLAAGVAAHSLVHGDRILLVGHSHAGQLFALLSHFLQGSGVAAALLQELNWQQQQRDALARKLDALRDVAFDVVTLGTPVRYRWARYPQLRLLPVINHRGDPCLTLRALYDVADGDYVQHWGMRGTNLPSFGAVERRLSSILQDADFEPARVLERLIDCMDGKPRPRNVPRFVDDEVASDNLLVDYCDQRPPGNTDPLYCGRVLLGHGVYTTVAKMEFNFQLIADAFYPEGSAN